MNYSLTGKARRAAKNTMQSKRVRAANVANYSNREATAETKCHLKWSDDGETLTFSYRKISDRSKSLNVK